MSNPKIVQIATNQYDVLGLDEHGNLYKDRIGYEGSIATHKWALIIDNNDVRELKDCGETNAGTPGMSVYDPQQN